MRHFAQALLLLSVVACLALSLPGCHFLDFVPRPTTNVMEEQFSVEPGKHYHRVPPYVFLSDFELDPKLPLFRELANLRDQVSRELELPTTQKLIRVHLFEDRTKYESYMANKYPDLPRRRAFFVAPTKPMGGVEELLAYTYWSDRIQQDLRHELTHALLHSVLLDVPIWLDEGLAEYFENPQGWSGINYKHLEHLQVQNGAPFQPNLARLETLKKVNDMTAADYREAWAWTHLMLRGPGKCRAALLKYLHELRTNREPGPLRPRLLAVLPNLDAALLDHLQKLNSAKPVKSSAH